LVDAGGDRAVLGTFREDPVDGPGVVVLKFVAEQLEASGAVAPRQD
jgi:hypothetical protein